MWQQLKYVGLEHERQEGKLQVAENSWVLMICTVKRGERNMIRELKKRNVWKEETPGMVIRSRPQWWEGTESGEGTYREWVKRGWQRVHGNKRLVEEEEEDRYSDAGTVCGETWEGRCEQERVGMKGRRLTEMETSHWEDWKEFVMWVPTLWRIKGKTIVTTVLHHFHVYNCVTRLCCGPE